MVKNYLPRIGLRTVKTAIAVTLSLWFVNLRGSPAPIFGAIGAISAMSRTLGDAVKTCITQFFGIVLGAAFGTIFVNIFADFRYIGVGLGMVGLMLLCIQLKLQFAVALACMVFVAICLSPPQDAFMYSVNRLIDTTIGLATALLVNIMIKPYNNRARIDGLIKEFLELVPSYVEDFIVSGRYPDLEPLQKHLGNLDWELGVFETQHIFRQHDHNEQVAFLRGLEQLAQAVVKEFSILCSMDERSVVSEGNADCLCILGLEVPEELPQPIRTQADVVGNYHLANLIQAYQYLRDFISM